MTKGGKEYEELAMGDGESPSTLRGLQAVYVQVENLDPDFRKELKKSGLTEETLHIRTERRLEVAGIKVLADGESGKSEGNGVLYVDVKVLAPEASEKYAYTVEGEQISKPAKVRKFITV